MARTLGANIRDRRRELGWSQDRLARAACLAAGITKEPLPLGRQEISRYESGRRAPRDWLPFLAQALSTTPQALSLVESAPPPLPVSVPKLADFLPEGERLLPLDGHRGHRGHRVHGLRRIGRSQVEALAGRVHGLRLADDVLAGRDLVGPALRELRTAVSLCRNSSYASDVGRALLVQLGELAQIAGWIASDAGAHAEAERAYRLGLGAAVEAGDTALAGNLAGSLGYMLSNLGTGREVEALDLVSAALHDAGPDAPPEVRALFWDRVAWAQARRGPAADPQAALRALGEASDAYARKGPPAPQWAYWVDFGELEIMEARVFTELSRPLRAVPLLRRVLGAYDASHARELALYRSWLAVALLDGREPEEAAAVAEHVLSADVASDRTARRARFLLERLRPFRPVPEVATLLAAHPPT